MRGRLLGHVRSLRGECECAWFSASAPRLEFKGSSEISGGLHPMYVLWQKIVRLIPLVTERAGPLRAVG